MKLKNKIIILIVLTQLILIGCNHYDSIQTSGRESAAGERSHNAGKDCMSCHHDPSSGASSSDKWWYIAGTAYSRYGSILTSGTVQFWTAPADTSGPKGNLVYSLPIDRSGNFYTSKIINFGNGLFPYVISSTGDTCMIQSVVYNGSPYPNSQGASCNSCHGNNGDGRNLQHVTFK